MKYWGKLGAFWGGLWGLLFGSTFFLVPGVGPIVSWIVGALQGAAVVGGISAVGAALYGIAIPKDSVLTHLLLAVAFIMAIIGMTGGKPRKTRLDGRTRVSAKRHRKVRVHE